MVRQTIAVTKGKHQLIRLARVLLVYWQIVLIWIENARTPANNKNSKPITLGTDFGCLCNNGICADANARWLGRGRGMAGGFYMPWSAGNVIL